MLKTPESKFNYLINYKRSQFELIRQVDIKKYNSIISLIEKAIKLKKNIFVCGNGGSAADAQHLAAEFIVRLRPHVNRNPIPALTLAQDTSTLTACGNDYSFEDIFLIWQRLE